MRRACSGTQDRDRLLPDATAIFTQVRERKKEAEGERDKRIARPPGLRLSTLNLFRAILLTPSPYFFPSPTTLSYHSIPPDTMPSNGAVTVRDEQRLPSLDALLAEMNNNGAADDGNSGIARNSRTGSSGTAAAPFAWTITSPATAGIASQAPASTSPASSVSAASSPATPGFSPLDETNADGQERLRFSFDGDDMASELSGKGLTPGWGAVRKTRSMHTLPHSGVSLQQLTATAKPQRLPAERVVSAAASQRWSAASPSSEPQLRDTEVTTPNAGTWASALGCDVDVAPSVTPAPGGYALCPSLERIWSSPAAPLAPAPRHKKLQHKQAQLDEREQERLSVLLEAKHNLTCAVVRMTLLLFCLTFGVVLSCHSAFFLMPFLSRLPFFRASACTTTNKRKRRESLHQTRRRLPPSDNNNNQALAHARCLFVACFY